MKVEQQPGYVLHARPYSETSLLVDFFTREHGRLMLIAKGARGAVGGGSKSRARGRLRGVLLPFKPLLISWRGRGQLQILTSAEQNREDNTEQPAPSAELKGQQLASAFYLNELLIRLLHRHDSFEALFTQYHRAIAQLTTASSPHQVLRVFEKKLLHHIGFGAVLDRDAETHEPISQTQHYYYLPEKGPVCIAAAGDHAIHHAIKISGGALCALRDEVFPSDRELREARQLTRMLIERQLNGRELASRRVLAAMNSYGEGRAKKN